MASLISSSIQEAFALVQAPLLAVKDSLKAIIPPDSVVLAETVQSSLTSGGKYLRPVVTLLSGQALQHGLPGIDPQPLVEVAAVTEMIHVATLLHDDVIDDSDLRRGKRTVRAEWGNKISVLSGDYLLAQASVKLSMLGNTRLVSIFAHVLADLCDGEVEQMHTSFTLNTSWDSYYKKTLGKTASLFSAGCESAGVLQGLPEVQIQALKRYGKHFGIAFQIVDDLLDYTATEAEMGKPVLDDLRNGLMNAPILLALESPQWSEAERTQLREAVEGLFENPSPETIAFIQDRLEQCQAVEETRRLAQRYIREAREALDFVAESPAKQSLFNLVDYILERRN
jgi:geranylgeranyl pyrophosphate synthase